MSISNCPNGFRPIVIHEKKNELFSDVVQNRLVKDLLPDLTWPSSTICCSCCLLLLLVVVVVAAFVCWMGRRVKRLKLNKHLKWPFLRARAASRRPQQWPVVDVVSHFGHVVAIVVAWSKASWRTIVRRRRRRCKLLTTQFNFCKVDRSDEFVCCEINPLGPPLPNGQACHNLRLVGISD